MFGIGDRPDQDKPDGRIEVAEVVMPGNPEGYIPDETGEEATDGNNEQVAAEKPETTLGSMGGVAV